jgi:isoleucyl-tRNA synthetase
VGTRGSAPYEGVLTHGYVVDGQGKKMSKSVGNVVAPQEVIEKYGAEILRLWVASEDYRDDVKVSDEILAQVTDTYRKIRNTIRYFLGNLSDFNPAVDRIAYDELEPLDKWALARFEELKSKVLKAYENYEFHSIYHGLNYFCTMTMSAFYLDIIKDRLYVSGTESKLRRSAQTALYEIGEGLLQLMSPILCFTASEAWDALKGRDSKAGIDGSIFFSDFPAPSKAHVLDDAAEKKWADLVGVRAEITKALEKARADKIIGHPLEAEVLIGAEGPLADFIGDQERMLKELSIVSELRVVERRGFEGLEPLQSEELEGLLIGVRAAPGEKCERCWIRSDTVGQMQGHPTICSRCFGVVESLNS